MNKFLKALVSCLMIAVVMLLPLSALAQDGGEDAPRIGFWEECPDPENLEGDVPVGVVFSQTGGAAQYGATQLNGAKLAEQQINESGYLGAATFVVVDEDGGSERETAIAAMTKLVEEDGVVAVIGPTLSSQAFAADPVAAEQGIPVMGVSNTANGITSMTEADDVNQFIFRNSLPEADVIPNTIAVAVAVLGIEKVAVMYGDDDDFTFSGYTVFVDALDENGVEILSENTFQKGDTDFEVALTNILADEPDALVVSALINEAIQIVIQARQLGYNGPIIGGNGFNSPALMVDAGDAAEGVLVGAAWNIVNQSPLNVGFVEAYTEAYGAAPDQFAAQAYTGTWLMATAIRCADSTSSDLIREELAAIEEFDSPLGLFSFDADRNPIHIPVVQIVDGGKFEVFSDAYADYFAE